MEGISDWPAEAVTKREGECKAVVVQAIPQRRRSVALLPSGISAQMGNNRNGQDRKTALHCVRVLPTLLLTAEATAQQIGHCETNQIHKNGPVGTLRGQLTHTSIRRFENWTYEMVQCTGPMYSSTINAALNAKLNHDELVS